MTQPSPTTSATRARPTPVRSHVLRYLLTFPIERARVDALWTVGGAGCLVLLPRRWRAGTPGRPAVGRRCLSVDRDQRQPRAAAVLRPGESGAGARRRLGRRDRVGAASGRGRYARLIAVGLLALVAVGVWRVNQFPKLVEQTLFDARYALGRIDRRRTSRALRRRRGSISALRRPGWLTRSCAAQRDRRIASTSSASPARPTSTPDRASASRFFWSRPVIVGFNGERPGYGVDGLLDDLQRQRAGDRRAAAEGLGARRRRLGDFFMAHAAARRLAASQLHPGADGPEASTSGCARRPRDARHGRCRASVRRGVLADRGDRARAARLSSRPPIPRGTPPSASSGTTRARGSTTRATRRSSAAGRSTLEPDVHRAGLHRRSSTSSFEPFGVGVRQARLVSELTGVAVGAPAGARRAAGSAAGAPASSPARCSRPTTST